MPAFRYLRDSYLRDSRSPRRPRPTSPRLAAIAVTAVVLASGGCGMVAYRLDRSPPETFVPNPVEVPPLSDQFVWSQVVDTVDDYFRISREQPVQNNGQLVLDGRLETAYQVGASMSEPWRKDSTAGFEALQSSLQSIRRKATVIVRPRGAAYSIEVIVPSPAG